MVDRQPQICYALLLFALCIIAYRGLPSQPWSYDDLDHIETAKRAQQDYKHIFAPEAKEPNRWVLNLYFYFAYRIFGENPSGFHAVKILLHTINALLSARLALALFARPLTAAFTGLLFVLNCVLCEAVYWIAATGFLIGTTAALLCILQIKFYLETNRKIHIAGAGVAYTVAFLSHESLIFIVIPACYLWWKQKSHPAYMLLAFGLPLVSFVYLDAFVYNTTSHKIDLNAGMLDWHVGYHFAFFVGRLFINAHFTPFGWDSPAPFDVLKTHFHTCALIGSLLFGLLLAFCRRNPIIRFATIWIFATTLPYIFNAQQFYFSRYWYLSAVGAALVEAMLLVAAGEYIGKTKRQRYALFGIGILIVTLFSLDKIKSYEGRFLLHAANFHLLHRKDAPVAVKLYERARNEYETHLALLYLHLSIAYAQTKQFSKALETSEKLLHIHPNYPNGYALLGEILISQQRYEQALKAFVQASQLDSTFVVNLHKMAQVCHRAGELSTALQAYQEILTHHSNYKNIRDCYLGISEIFYLQGETDTAASVLREVLGIYPDYPEAQALLESLPPH